jgi:hypothetical protein
MRYKKIIMKPFSKTILGIFVLLLLIPDIGHAQRLDLQKPRVAPMQMGLWYPGLISPRDFMNPEASLFAVMDYNVFFQTGSWHDHLGNQPSLDFDRLDRSVSNILDMSGYINALAFAYSTPEIPFLGNARYAAAISPAYITASYSAALGQVGDTTLINVDGTVSGISDLIIAPLVLTWVLDKGKWDITTDYMFSIPTGRYEVGGTDNVGLGYWTHTFQMFTYYYPLPLKVTGLYLGHSYEVHGWTKDVDVRSGSRYTLDYGVSQFLPGFLELFVQGGSQWQVSRDQGDDVYWDASIKDRVHTVGVGVGWWPSFAKFYINAKWWTNYGQRQHFETSAWQIQLIWVPWMNKEDRKNYDSMKELSKQIRSVKDLKEFQSP